MKITMCKQTDGGCVLFADEQAQSAVTFRKLSDGIFLGQGEYNKEHWQYDADRTGFFYPEEFKKLTLPNSICNRKSNILQWHTTETSSGDLLVECVARDTRKFTITVDSPLREEYTNILKHLFLQQTFPTGTIQEQRIRKLSNVDGIINPLQDSLWRQRASKQVA